MVVMNTLPVIAAVLHFNASLKYGARSEDVVHPGTLWKGPYFLTSTPTLFYKDLYLCLKEHHGGAPVEFEANFVVDVIYRLSVIIDAYQGRSVEFVVFPRKDLFYPYYFYEYDDANAYLQEHDTAFIATWPGGPTPHWTGGNVYLERIDYDYDWYYVPSIPIKQMYTEGECLIFPVVQFNTVCFYLQETSNLFPAGCQATRRSCGNNVIQADLGKWFLHAYSICGRYPAERQCYSVYRLPELMELQTSSGLIFNLSVPFFSTLKVVVVDDVYYYLDELYYKSLLHFVRETPVFIEALRYKPEEQQYCYFTNFTQGMDSTRYLHGKVIPKSGFTFRSIYLTHYENFQERSFTIIFTGVIKAIKLDKQVLKFEHIIRSMLIVSWDKYLIVQFITDTLRATQMNFTTSEYLQITLPSETYVTIAYADPAIFGLHHYKREAGKVSYKCIVDPVRWEQAYWIEDLLENLMLKVADLVVRLLEELLKVILEVTSRLLRDIRGSLQDLQHSYLFLENLALFVFLFVAVKRLIFVILLIVLSMLVFGIEREVEVEIF